MAVNILFTGDIVLQDEHSVKSIWSTSLENMLSEYEYKCCNFEGAITVLKQKSSKIGPNIMQNERSCEVLRASGFNIFALANNHIMDYVVLIAHCGAEQINYPLPEWRYRFFELIDAGVDVVIGHHPHVVQGWETYHNGYIFYSLGNFIWEKKPYYDPKTIIVGITFDEKGTHEQVIPVIYYQGEIDILQDEEFNNQLRSYCDVLNNNSQYKQLINDICLRLYNERYVNHFYKTVNMNCPNGLKSLIKNIIQSIKKEKKINSLEVFHNCGIETHRMICARASRLVMSFVCN